MPLIPRKRISIAFEKKFNRLKKLKVRLSAFQQLLHRLNYLVELSTSREFHTT